MTKIEIGTRVKVDGKANQPPFERIVDEGEVLDNTKGYLVKLKKDRENLIFKRSELMPISKYAVKVYWEMCADVEVKAYSKTHAKQEAIDAPLPESGTWEYVSDSANVDKGIDVQEIVS